jgi:arabinofuranosyltransferase
LVAGAFFVYVASVGGDFMGLFRFALPIVPLLVLSASLGLWLVSARLRPMVMVPLVVALLAGHVWHAIGVDKKSLTIGADRGIDTPGFLRWYTADRAAIGKWFGQYVKDDDYAAVGGAGAQVYYSGIRSLDCFGLSDEYIAHKVPAHSSRPGHQKYAPDEYILSKKPTIITSHNYRIGGAPYVGADEAIWRARGYHYVSVQIPGLSSPWYSFLLRNDRSLGPLPAEHGREP